MEGNAQLSIALGRPVVNKISFNDFVELYMEQYTDKDPSTQGRLDWWCNRIGNLDMTQITEFYVDDGLIALSNTVIKTTGKKYTASTINRYKSTLSGLFIHFQRHPEYKRLAIANPTKADLVTRFSENSAKERFLTETEQVCLLEACKQSDWDKLYLLVLMALTTGARKNEMLYLKWAEIDFDNKLAALHTSKNGKPRLLVLLEPVIEELRILMMVIK